ncbi:hypothetical protein COO60DRAFT_680403 [Scenedesmus sp. NREL 46B-D3]|nr:hypothetical protein COO60DRAFT_680403 [Scenedesmus sp. NREL 46B-D3]
MVSAEVHAPTIILPAALGIGQYTAHNDADAGGAGVMDADEAPAMAQAVAPAPAPASAAADCHSPAVAAADADEQQEDEQATVAMLAMLASAAKQVPSSAGAAGAHYGSNYAAHTNQHLYEADDDTDAAAEVHQLGTYTVKRTSSSAGLHAAKRHNKKQRRNDSGAHGGSSPSSLDSPDSMGGAAAAAAAAAAAGLYKLSSATANEFEAGMTAHRLAPAPGEYAAAAPHAGHLGKAMQGNSGGSSGAVAGGASGKETSMQIMTQLVESGVLPDCRPDTHCYVKCGHVQGVFSLASGTVLCLCNECSDSSGGAVWFAPAAFERHGGMAASKKWRGSIQVKGLSNRKTLGQWLDERGVTAKPRLTLADQVQQHTQPGDTKKPRGGAAAAQAAAHAAAASSAAAAAPGARVAEDFSDAAANAARLTAGDGVKAPAAVPVSPGGSWGNTALQAAAAVNAMRGGSAALDLDALELHQQAPAAAAADPMLQLQQLVRGSSNPADHHRHQQQHQRQQQQQPMDRASLYQPSRIEQLLAELAAAPAAGSPHSRAAGHLAAQQEQQQAASYAHTKELQQQQQQVLDGFLQQLQRLQQASAEPAPPAPVPAPARAGRASSSAHVDPLALLVELLPDLFGGDRAAAASSLRQLPRRQLQQQHLRRSSRVCLCCRVRQKPACSNRNRNSSSRTVPSGH